MFTSIKAESGLRGLFQYKELDVTSNLPASEGPLALRDQKPDAIVIDIHLPDADGLVAFDKIKVIDARVPIILITGHGTTELAITRMAT